MNEQVDGVRVPPGVAVRIGAKLHLATIWQGRGLLLYRIDFYKDRPPAVRELIPSAAPGFDVDVTVED